MRQNFQQPTNNVYQYVDRQYSIPNQNQFVPVTNPPFNQVPAPTQTLSNSQNVQLKSLHGTKVATLAPTTISRPMESVLTTPIPPTTTTIISIPQTTPEFKTITTFKPLETTKSTTPYQSIRAKPEMKALTIRGSTVKPTSSSERQRKIVSDSNELNYFWKLENFPKAFKNRNAKNEVYSYVFKVNGLRIRIRSSMDFNEDLKLELEHLANVDDREMNVELFDGIVFKEIATEKLFQYHFVIIDTLRPNHDLISPIFWNTDSDGFLIHNSVSLLSSYTKNDSILVKLVISF